MHIGVLLLLHSEVPICQKKENMKTFRISIQSLLSVLVPLLCITLFAACQKEEGDGEEVMPTENCTSVSSTFTINLDPNECNVDIEAILGKNSQYSESINGATRSITINGIANHNVGTFPRNGNPNTIGEAIQSFSMTTEPSIANSVTNGQGYDVAILFSGVAVDPYTAEFFLTSAGGVNRDWNITTLTTSVNLGLDCNNAHVQPTGKYHYHGTPSAFVADLGATGSEMVKVGYAGDGFPIYYKYAYTGDGSSIVAFESGYQLKDGSRPGNGSTAPDGCYDGTYFQDYEYVAGVSELDECNGRFGITPEAADGEYYYLITDNFPSVPLCFSGTPDPSFNKR